MNKTNKNNQKGVTILISILILSSVIILALGVADIVARSSRSSRNIGTSEVAYFAAEMGVEKALYSIERRRSVLSQDLPAAGSLTDISGASWNREITPNYTSGIDCNSSDWEDEVITSGLCVENNGQLNVRLSTANPTFQLEMDFAGFGLPEVLHFNGLTNNNASSTIWQQETNGDITQTTETPNNINLNNKPTSIRIDKKAGSSPLDFSINPTGSSGVNIPLSFIIRVTGKYLDQERRVQLERKNWQIY
jgi:hypothetical protein